MVGGRKLYSSATGIRIKPMKSEIAKSRGGREGRNAGVEVAGGIQADMQRPCAMVVAAGV